MPQNDPTVEGAGRAYRKCHLHLARMLENLSGENLQTQLPGTKESISRIFQHIINAECYWLGQVKEPHPEMVKRQPQAGQVVGDPGGPLFGVLNDQDARRYRRWSGRGCG